MKQRFIKNRTKKLLVVAAAICLVAGLLGWYFMKNSKSELPKFTGPVENVSTGLIGEYGAQILVAQEKGYFSQYGLNVDIKEFTSGPEALTALLSGQVDTAMASDFAGVRNSFKNEDLRALANMSKSEAFFMIARKDHGISDVADLTSKKIGITRKTVGEFYLGQFLIFNRSSINNMRIVDMTQGDLVNAVETGTIDAAVLFEPNAYKAEKALGNTSLRWSVQSGQSINSLLYARGQLVRERPQVVERYLRALLAAESYMTTHDAETKTLIGRRFNYNSEYLNYIWPRFSFMISLDQELLLSMDDEAQWAIENGLTGIKTRPNYLHFLYLDGLDHVKPERITIIR